MFNFRFKGSAAPTEFVLSGYTTEEKYNNRQLDWEDDTKYLTKDEAVAAAILWQQNTGPSSTVEIIELKDSTGNVRAVVGKAGTENI